MYTMILADGTEIENLTLNGNTYVSPVKINEDLFKGNMSTVTFTDGEKIIEMHNVRLLQQIEYQGEFYLTFRELTQSELKESEINGKLEYIAMMADIDLEEM